MDITAELERLRALVAGKTAPVEPLYEVTAVKQDGALRRRWWCGGGRELLAGQATDGAWMWLEYTFSVNGRKLVLRWFNGQRATLWQVDKNADRSPLNPGSELLMPLQEGIPATEKAAYAELAVNLPTHLHQLLQDAFQNCAMARNH